MQAVGISEGLAAGEDAMLVPACTTDLWDVLRVHYPQKVRAVLCASPARGARSVWDALKMHFPQEVHAVRISSKRCARCAGRAQGTLPAKYEHAMRISSKRCALCAAGGGGGQSVSSACMWASKQGHPNMGIAYALDRGITYVLSMGIQRETLHVLNM